jgi:hypothetical protein
MQQYPSFILSRVLGVIFLLPLKLVKVNQSHYRPEVPRGFQEFKVPRYVTMAQDG